MEKAPTQRSVPLEMLRTAEGAETLDALKRLHQVRFHAVRARSTH